MDFLFSCFQFYIWLKKLKTWWWTCSLNMKSIILQSLSPPQKKSFQLHERVHIYLWKISTMFIPWHPVLQNQVKHSQIIYLSCLLICNRSAKFLTSAYIWVNNDVLIVNTRNSLDKTFTHQWEGLLKRLYEMYTVVTLAFNNHHKNT